MRDIPAQDALEAGKLMLNQRQYLQLLFTQTVDPYYNKPKWLDGCIEANLIGEIQQQNNQLAFVSTLYMNQEGKEGYCPVNEGVSPWHLVYLYCGQGSLLEVRYPIEGNPEGIINQQTPEQLCQY